MRFRCAELEAAYQHQARVTQLKADRLMYTGEAGWGGPAGS